MAAGLEIVQMQAGDDLRMGEVPLLRPLTGQQAACLQQRAHTAVKIQMSLFQKLQPDHLVSSNPTMAVTDFAGVIKSPCVSPTPSVRRASRTDRISCWLCMGRSP